MLDELALRRILPTLCAGLASCVAPVPRRSAAPTPPASESRAATQAAEPERESETPGVETPAAETPTAQPDAAPLASPAPQAEAQAGEAPAAEPSPAGADTRAAAGPETAPARLLSGSLALRYRGRATGDEQDHDLRTLLTLDLADPRAPWISAHLLARVDGDLDGEDGPVYQELSDTYDESVVAKLYLAYADVALGARPEEGPGTLRVGRQSDARLPEVLRLDGLSFLSRPMGARDVELGLYGGVPARLYEDSHEGDRAYGTFVEGRPWAGGRARVDWMHLEDEVLLGEGRDDLLALGLWHTLSQRVRLEGEFSHLEGDPRDVRVRALYDDPDTESLVRFGYFELLESQKFRVQELDPFTEQLLEYFPYRQGNLNVSRALGEHAVLDLGLDVRRMSDSGDVGEFNREWERYYATATWRDAFTPGLSLSLTGDRWDDDERDTSALGADCAYEQEPWRVALGSYYSLYKYELLELSERDDVRTYYVRATRELSARVRLDCQYEFEDDDLDTYHTVRLGVLWRF